jgi:hypothetical protein
MSSKKNAETKTREKHKKPVDVQASIGGQKDADITLRALSIRQPFIEQILRGDKKVEYRGTPTKVRGRIYLYASLGRYSKTDEEELTEDVGFEFDNLPRGLLIGTVEIVDCEEIEDGVYGWHLRNPQRLPKLLKPTQRANPVWFYPYVSPSKS